jgi:hypothetical protein
MGFGSRPPRIPELSDLGPTTATKTCSAVSHFLFAYFFRIDMMWNGTREKRKEGEGRGGKRGEKG